MRVRERFLSLFRRYAHVIPTVALLVGFVWDTLTLKRPDTLFENATVVSYLLVAAGAILMLSIRSALSRDQKVGWLTLLQFSFGNLSSALFVLYIKSGAIAGGLLFIIVLVALLLGNEFLKERYTQTWVNVSVWFVLLLTYCTIIVPVVLNDFGDAVFLEGVAVAFVLMSMLLALLSVFARHAIVQHILHIVLGTVGITVLFILLYVTGSIPPVPLATRTIAIAHSVVHNDGTYTVRYEAPRWYAFWRDASHTFTTNNMTAYCFSAIFAPSDIHATMYHHWEHKSTAGAWVTVARIPFVIAGGRGAGYRGYTVTQQLQPGEWRCSAETERGAVIGRTSVTVVQSDALPKVTEATW